MIWPKNTFLAVYISEVGVSGDQYGSPERDPERRHDAKLQSEPCAFFLCSI